MRDVMSRGRMRSIYRSKKELENRRVDKIEKLIK